MALDYSKKIYSASNQKYLKIIASKSLVQKYARMARTQTTLSWSIKVRQKRLWKIFFKMTASNSPYACPGPNLFNVKQLMLLVDYCASLFLFSFTGITRATTDTKQFKF